MEDFVRHTAPTLWRRAMIVVRDLGRTVTTLPAVFVGRLARRCRAVREREERLRAIIDSTPDALISSDLEGTILSWNRGAASMFGYSSDEAVGRSLSILMPERLRGHQEAALARLRMGKASKVSGQGVIRAVAQRKDGHEFPIELKLGYWTFGNTPYITATLHDITARQQAEERVRAGEDYLRLLLESSGEGVFAVDLDGICTLANPAAARMLGYDDPARLIGKNAHALFHHSRPDGSPYPPEDCAVYAVLRGGREYHVTDEFFWRADGAGFPVSYHSYLMRRNGKIVGAVVNFVDMTEELAKRRRESISERMETLGKLAGGVAHDLNNMLLPVLTLTEMVTAELPDGDRNRVRLAKVLEAAARARTLVGNILKFGRQEDDTVSEPLDIAAVLAETIGLLRETIPATVSISEHLDPDAGSVLADPSQIHTIVMNLAVNAAQAMGLRPGTLDISLSRKSVDERLAGRLGGIAAGPYAHISVSDSGNGMDAATMARAFDPFFTTKPDGEGTGLGLSVVFGTVKKLSGSVAVDSTVGIGTTFEIYLPINADDEKKKGPELQTERG